jgi:CheY-like chemotaxis protein
MLKGLGALELVRRLRTRDEGGTPLADIPVLIVAGSADEIDRDRALDAGADDVLLPPLELESLIPDLFRIVSAWRAEHPERPWADEAAQRKDQ